jgi:hypothetical protein
MVRYVLPLLALTAVTFGQVTPTHIGKHQINETLQEWSTLEPQAWASYNETRQKTDITPHRLGETFSEWMKLNQMDLTAMCGKHSRNDNSMDYKAVCKRLTAMRDTGIGDFYARDESHAVGWRFADGKVADYSIDGKWHSTVVTPERQSTPDEFGTTGNNRAYTWKFLNGKLTSVMVTPDWTAIYKIYNEIGIERDPEIVPSFQEEVNFLAQVYGKPTMVSTPYHNGFGAQWERSSAVWAAPDGAQIVAFERTGFNQQGQLELVSFHSRDSPEKTEQTKPNPYK